jgi:predicted Zn-dependent protease
MAPLAAAAAGVGEEGHRLQRFPLRVWLEPDVDRDVDTVLDRVLSDWNAVFREALATSVDAFVRAETKSASDVIMARARQDEYSSEEIFRGTSVLAYTSLLADEHGLIRLPVRIYIRPDASLPQLDHEASLYVVVAHELGHALGLPHTEEPGSIMYYTRARHQTEVRGARAQLAAHYTRFWSVPR